MKGLIFDLDGTLLDSMPSWGRQLDDLLTGRGITPPADLLDRTKTLGLENATGMVLEEFGLPDDPAIVYQQFQENQELFLDFLLHALKVYHLRLLQHRYLFYLYIFLFLGVFFFCHFRVTSLFDIIYENAQYN